MTNKQQRNRRKNGFSIKIDEYYDSNIYDTDLN